MFFTFPLRTMVSYEILVFSHFIANAIWWGFLNHLVSPPYLLAPTPSQDLGQLPEHSRSHKCLLDDWHFFIAKYVTRGWIHMLRNPHIWKFLEAKIWQFRWSLNLNKENQTSHYLKVSAWVCCKCIFIIFIWFPQNFIP